jgi:hypothetical protein
MNADGRGTGLKCLLWLTVIVLWLTVCAGRPLCGHVVVERLFAFLLWSGFGAKQTLSPAPCTQGAPSQEGASAQWFPRLTLSPIEYAHARVLAHVLGGCCWVVAGCVDMHGNARIIVRGMVGRALGRHSERLSVHRIRSALSIDKYPSNTETGEK